MKLIANDRHLDSSKTSVRLDETYGCSSVQWYILFLVILNCILYLNYVVFRKLSNCLFQLNWNLWMVIISFYVKAHIRPKKSTIKGSFNAWSHIYFDYINSVFSIFDNFVECKIKHNSVWMSSVMITNVYFGLV